MSIMETHLSHSGPMNPSTAQPASFEAWQALVAPGDVFRRPSEVLAHPLLSEAERHSRWGEGYRRCSTERVARVPST